MVSALFMTYFSVILARRVSEQGQTVFIGILVSAFIVLLDLMAAKTINIMVSFEKHFSSAGRNWKRISYLSAFIIFNSLAAILAYCASEPLALKSKTISGIVQAMSLDESYELSFNEWLQSCSGTPYTSPHGVIARLSRQNVDVHKTIGYWRQFTSQVIDGFPVPTFAYDLDSNPRKEKMDFNIQIGCHAQKYLCNAESTTRIFSDSCAFISNMSVVSAASSVPNIFFGGAFYDLPWKNVSMNENSLKFRLNSFANEGSLYGFLFAFLLLKAARMVLYYLYNSLTSFFNHRLLLPLLKWQGFGADVRALYVSFSMNCNCYVILSSRLCFSFCS